MGGSGGGGGGGRARGDESCDRGHSETMGALAALDYVKELQKVDLATKTIGENNISSETTAKPYEAVMENHYQAALSFEEKYGMSLSTTSNAKSARARFYHVCKTRGIELEVKDE